MPLLSSSAGARRGRLTGAAAPVDPLYDLLAVERSRAERLLNLLRLGIVAALAIAALAYAPELPRPLRLANGAVVVPMLAWSIFQALHVARRAGIYPAWLSRASPIVDVTAVTAIILCYGLIQGPAIALKAPITLVYFAIFGARPIIGSMRLAAVTVAVTLAEYVGAIVVLCRATGGIVWGDPITAAASSRVAALDEVTKVVLLAAAGIVATYAAGWHERVLREALAAQVRRDAEERETAARLQEADKLAALGTLAASVAHEVASPLTAIAVSAEMLARELAAPSDRAEAMAIAADARRTAGAVRDLLVFARHGHGEVAELFLGDVVTRSAAMLRNLVRDAGVHIELDVDADLPTITGRAEALQRVVINLVINAVQAMDGQTTPRIVRVQARPVGDGAQLVVEDTGPGFTRDVAAHLFDRFFTTKPAGQGTGLGLWMVAQTVAEHGGRIEAVDTGAGARFVVTLPAVLSAAVA